MARDKSSLGTIAFVLGTLALGSFFSPTAEATTPKKAGKGDLSCSKRSLGNKDCHLKAGKLAVHLFKDKIIVADAIHRGLSDLPASGDAVEWHSAKLKTLAGRDFLELELWAPPAGEIGVQSLTWHVYEILNGEPQSRLNKVVQKRRKVSDQPVQYKYDKSKERTLYEKSRKVLWKADRESGEIQPLRSQNEI